MTPEPEKSIEEEQAASLLRENKAREKIAFTLARNDAIGERARQAAIDADRCEGEAAALAERFGIDMGRARILRLVLSNLAGLHQEISALVKVPAGATLEEIQDDAVAFTNQLLHPRGRCVIPDNLGADLGNWHLTGVLEILDTMKLEIEAGSLISALLSAVWAIREVSVGQSAQVTGQRREAAALKPAPAWHADAKREKTRLIAQGTAPRNVASKIARMPQFSTYGVKAIRNALKSTR